MDWTHAIIALVVMILSAAAGWFARGRSASTEGPAAPPFAIHSNAPADEGPEKAADPEPTVEETADVKRFRHSEAKIRAVLEAAVDGIITIDEIGRIETFNRAARTIFGYEEDEVVGKNVSVLMPDPYQRAHDGYLRNYLTTVEPRVIGIGREVLGRRKDGTTFPMDLAVGEAYLAGRRIFAGIVRDITSRKQVEAELRNAKDDAERANLAKTKFLAAASHDLRQPVQSLIYFAEALSTRITDPKIKGVVADMEMAIAALKGLLDNLLDVSKLDAGVVSVHPQPVDMERLLGSVRVTYEGVATAKGVDLRVRPCAAHVQTDPALFRQLLGNFIHNAVRYTERGGILVGCRRRGDQLRVEVWDSGVGIAPGQTEEIFEEFTQIGNPERDRAQGLGLGLAIVRRLSRLMGHPVGVRSAPGHGSVFWVELPLVEVAAEPEAPQSAAVAAAGTIPHLADALGSLPGWPRREPEWPLPKQAVGGMAAAAAEVLRSDQGGCTDNEAELSGDLRDMIVLIDDEPVVLASLSVVLQSWGYDVVAAASSSDAVRTLSGGTRKPSMILADYRLREGRTGTEAIHDLCAHFNCRIPGIIITGDTAPERIREAAASGISVLHKPVTPPVLLEALSRARVVREAVEAG